LESQSYPALEYVVPRLLPEGFTLLIGAPKAGKSWLSLDIALAVAKGGQVLGETVQQRPVLHLALEDSHRRLRSRSKVLRPDERLPAEWEHMLRIPVGYSAPQVVEAWLEQLPNDNPPPLVIVDTLGKVRPGKRPGEGVYDYDYRIGGRMKALADSVPGASLAAVHHDRKAASADFVDDVSGSNGLAGSADTNLVVRRERNSSDGVLHVTGRDVIEGNYAASFTNGSWSLTGGTWETASAAYAEVAAVIGKGDTAQRIVAYVVKHTSATPKEVSEALGISHDSARQALSRLHADHRLDRDAGTYFLPRQEGSP
jgi:RecA-family ATPase